MLGDPNLSGGQRTLLKSFLSFNLDFEARSLLSAELCTPGGQSCVYILKHVGAPNVYFS